MIEDGPKLFGYLLSLNAVVVIVVQYPLIMIAKRYSTILSLTTGNVLLAGSLFAIAFHKVSVRLLLLLSCLRLVKCCSLQ